MTAAMNYCDDNDSGWLNPEVNPKRKARHQRAARVAMNYRVRKRLFGN